MTSEIQSQRTSSEGAQREQEVQYEHTSQRFRVIEDNEARLSVQLQSEENVVSSIKPCFAESSENGLQSMRQSQEPPTDLQEKVLEANAACDSCEMKPEDLQNM